MSRAESDVDLASVQSAWHEKLAFAYAPSRKNSKRYSY